MNDACSSEIIELHQFFVDWYKGGLVESELNRFTRVMADDFQIITPGGRIIRRAPLVESIKSAYGVYRDQVFDIQIRNISVRPAGTGLFLATYEEWQNREGQRRGRLSTALFRLRADAPNGLEWVHVHETWLPGN